MNMIDKCKDCEWYSKSHNRTGVSHHCNHKDGNQPIGYSDYQPKWCPIRSSTNSPIGSSHWFITLVSRHKHIGEFLNKKTPDDDVLRKWGKTIYEDCEELIRGFEHINKNSKNE